tara:strand:- start:4330 stop:4722 length:393 start_codon:yes stop_codon:yes gene_type:complete
MQRAIKNPNNKFKWKEKWIFAKPLIKAALKHTDCYNLKDVEEGIKNGVFHLWVGEKSAMITEIIEYPQLRAINLLFCGGDYKELQSMLPSIEQFGKHFGCKRLYGGGRKGWLRKLKPLGFVQEYMIRKEI